MTEEQEQTPPQPPTLEQLNGNRTTAKIAALRSLAIQMANLNVQLMAMLHNLEQES